MNFRFDADRTDKYDWTVIALSDGFLPSGGWKSTDERDLMIGEFTLTGKQQEDLDGFTENQQKILSWILLNTTELIMFALESGKISDERSINAWKRMISEDLFEKQTTLVISPGIEKNFNKIKIHRTPSQKTTKDVRAALKKLKLLTSLEADVIDVETVRAIKDFEKQQKWFPNGYLSKNELKKLLELSQTFVRQEDTPPTKYSQSNPNLDSSINDDGYKDHSLTQFNFSEVKFVHEKNAESSFIDVTVPYNNWSSITFDILQPKIGSLPFNGKTKISIELLTTSDNSSKKNVAAIKFFSGWLSNRRYYSSSGNSAYLGDLSNGPLSYYDRLDVQNLSSDEQTVLVWIIENSSPLINKALNSGRITSAKSLQHWKIMSDQNLFYDRVSSNFSSVETINEKIKTYKSINTPSDVDKKIFCRKFKPLDY